MKPIVYAGDYVRKDGYLRRVLRVDNETDTCFTDDGGCIGLGELTHDDVLLESEAIT